jgi:hypothetical protein
MEPGLVPGFCFWRLCGLAFLSRSTIRRGNTVAGSARARFSVEFGKPNELLRRIVLM